MAPGLSPEAIVARYAPASPAASDRRGLIDALAVLLRSHPDPSVQEAAAGALGDLFAWEAADVLVDALRYGDDPDRQQVARAAEAALGRIRWAPPSAVYIRGLQHPHPAVGRRLSSLLRVWGNPKGWDEMPEDVAEALEQYQRAAPTRSRPRDEV